MTGRKGERGRERGRKRGREKGRERGIGKREGEEDMERNSCLVSEAVWEKREKEATRRKEDRKGKEET